MKTTTHKRLTARVILIQLLIALIALYPDATLRVVNAAGAQQGEAFSLPDAKVGVMYEYQFANDGGTDG